MASSTANARVIAAPRTPSTSAPSRGWVGSISRPVIDTYAKGAFAKLYDRKTPITAAEILNDRVVPFYDEHAIRLSRMLTDRGTEFCGTQSHVLHEMGTYAHVLWRRKGIRSIT